MTGSTLSLSNRQARRLWLHSQGMLASPQGPDTLNALADTVARLGMVQLDTINNVARAQHHILWSRHPAYRDSDYNALLGSNPRVFEHFSHDAVILPLTIYPYWQRQRQRRSDQYKRGALGKQLAGQDAQRSMMRDIRKNGPMCSRDFAANFTQRADKTEHAWMRPPHKLALDYLWLKGDLCVSHRQGFGKYYELAERIIPASVRKTRHPHDAQIDHLCTQALARLGFAHARDIQGFHDACDLSEVKQWLEHNCSDLCDVNVQNYAGEPVLMKAPGTITSLLESLPKPSQRLRILNPFDPIVRNRSRLKMLFGMDYRIEIYTPAAKRQYGYYVYPILEGDRITGRIDVRADRANSRLEIKAWWLEPGVKHSAARQQRLGIELKRLAKLANVDEVGNIPPPSPHP